MADDLGELERWLGRIQNGLAPARRRAFAAKLGQALRRSNLMRISANVEPDGGAMEKRKKPKKGGGPEKVGGRMFRRLRLAKAWKVAADADGVEIKPASSSIDRVAAVHQYGETDTVARLRDGRTLRAKYPERRLLGLSNDDRTMIVEVVGSLLDPDAD